MIVYQQLCATTKDPLKENPSLAEMIYGLIKEQARMISNLPTSSSDDLIYCGFAPFDVVKVICFSCRKPLPPDTKAMWSVMRLGHYVPRRRRCHRLVLRKAQRRNSEGPLYSIRLEHERALVN